MLSSPERKEKIKGVVRAASGNFLELYDYLVYLLYATYIAAAFFPTGSEFSSLMLALGTYGMASFARPFGAVILGAYSDRKGRRKGLILSLSLMAGRSTRRRRAPAAISPGCRTSSGSGRPPWEPSRTGSRNLPARAAGGRATSALPIPGTRHTSRTTGWAPTGSRCQVSR